MLSTTEALSRVSHEFRNPLNAILAFGQLLALEELSDSQRHSVEQILAGGRHLLALAEDLLELSRLAGGNLEMSEATVDARDEIAQAISLCGPLAAERSLTLRHDGGGEPVWVLADERRLRQVLLNLISNAINYNRAGGSVTLRVTRDANERVRIDVIDTGVGMSADQLSRLFTPFERLDAPLRGVAGNGLGLVVCKALTEAMGGSIEVVSSPGSGSVFSVRLPVAELAPCQELRPGATRVLTPAA
ncbi:MAG TPA: HAMP domain-containing sensor histidine kinase [Solirubrobacteraceae bacterium]|nr:HAMP domain-containing sensor histidine kinase [Solirubrobacteraceae bacterium]